MLSDLIHQSAQALTGAENDYDNLMRAIGDASIVLLGEASHGTHEFYAERARISQRLIREKGFSALAVEADWPDAYRVNRYIRLQSDEISAYEALSDFKRFPTWMWRNAEIEKFVQWLYQWNKGLDQGQRIGFYGLDLYSLHASSEVVIRYLEKIDPRAAEEARERYACFEHCNFNMQDYGFFSRYGLAKNCEQEVLDQLITLQKKTMDYMQYEGNRLQDEFMNAEQNARIVKNAEKYYRSMFHSNVLSWNLRDHHMTETVGIIRDYLSRSHREAKIIVWAHNSHLGDERATEMAKYKQVNVGQLLREIYGDQVFSLGFSTYTGTVTAASSWDFPAVVKRVNPGLPDSWESLFHQTHMKAFLLNLKQPELVQQLTQSKLQRAIGVIYLPETERQSHYFEARLIDQFDALIHIDRTNALIPLEPNPEWEMEEAPETYPFGV